MNDLELKRLEELRDFKSMKFDILYEYEQLGSPKELYEKAFFDFKLVDKLLKSGQNEYRGLYNLLHNFIWFMWSSDHKTEPTGLIEDENYGVSYYGIMQEIYNKFYQKNTNGKETSN